MIVDDHLVVRRGIRSLIEDDPAWIVCGETGDGLEALQMAPDARPDVVIVDMSMPVLGGIDLTHQMRKLLPEVEILILTMHDGERFISGALRAGARGYLLKSESENKLIHALNALSRHQPYFSSPIADALLTKYLSSNPSDDPQQLTSRERQIVKLVAEGNSNKRIAQILKISVKTVETHRSSAMRKIGAKSSADLTVYAARNELIEI
jgi:DNA-binding NarL/FixJ family response regulator